MKINTFEIKAQYLTPRSSIPSNSNEPSLCYKSQKLSGISCGTLHAFKQI
jgi:hypothetical protein